MNNLRDKLWDLGPEAIAGAVAGIVVGLWAVKVHGSLTDETTILLAIGGSDVALLAVVLAAAALMASFLGDFFGLVIEGQSADRHERARNIKGFFRPFWIVAVAAGLGTLTCFAGAINAHHGARELRSAVFGLAIGLSVWTVVGSVLLVSVFVRATIKQRELVRDESQPWQPQ